MYAQAGLQLLDRDAPAGYQREWTEYFAGRKKPAAGPRLSVIVFRVGPEWLALPTHAFQEVAEPRAVHSIPHRRHGVLLGLVNIRGELLLCVSVGRLLASGQDTSSEKLRTYYDRLLVVMWEGRRLVFPAEEVDGICRLSHDEVVSPPATTSKPALSFIHGIFPWRSRMVGLLEPDSLFSTISRYLT